MPIFDRRTAQLRLNNIFQGRAGEEMADIVRGMRQSADFVTASINLLPEQSGATLFLHNANGFSVVMPQADMGLSYDILVTTAPSGGEIAFTAPEGSIWQSLVGGASDATQFRLTTSAAVGFYAHLICDGESWHVIPVDGGVGGYAFGDP